MHIRESETENTIKSIVNNVKDWANEDEVAAYIEKIIRREAFDRAGLIYGMGHAIYTYSDPRCVLLKERAKKLAEKNEEFKKEYDLYALIEKLTPDVFDKVKNNGKVMCANVDLYSGFVYKMLGIPKELYTPIFAVSRVVGWCAHRIEEVIAGGKIIRPAYKSISQKMEYINIENREND